MDVYGLYEDSMVSMDGYGDSVMAIGVYGNNVMSMEVYGGLYKRGTWL